MLLICGYGLIAFVYNLVDETVPIYASTPIRHNGLALDSNQVGLALSIGGIALMVAAVSVYPRVQKLIGSHKCATYFFWWLCFDENPSDDVTA